MNLVTETPSPGQPEGYLRSPPETPAGTSARSRRTLRQTLRALALPLGALVLVVGIGVSGTWWITEGRFIESTDNAYVQGDIAVLGPRIEGDVVAIPVADNQAVRSGDVLIRLDPADWQARLDQANAAKAEADAAVDTARRQLLQQQATIQAAAATIAQAEAERVRAGADAQRSANLATAGWASHQANDLAIADSRKAAAALTASIAQKAAAEQQLAVLAAQLAQAEARQRNAEAAARLAANNMAYTAIRAPFDGIAGNRAAELGQHVAPGAQLIAVAPPAEKLYVVANFKETQLRRMQPGMKVRLTPDIDGSAVVDGRVDSLAPATGALFSLLPPENATGNFTKVVQRVPVKIVIDTDAARAAGWLRAGLSVTAEVDTRGPDAERLGLFGIAAATLRQAVP